MSKPNWEDQRGRGCNPAEWIALWLSPGSGAEKQEKDSRSWPATITRKTKPQMQESMLANLPWPTPHYNPHRTDCKGAEATFQPKWSLLTAVEPAGKYRAIDALTCFPTLSPSQPISAEPDRGDCDTQDSVLQLVASGCRKAAPETQRSGDSSPATSHHRGGALRPRRLGCKEGIHLLRRYRAFSKAGATSITPQWSWMSQDCKRKQKFVLQHHLLENERKMATYHLAKQWKESST